MSQNVNKKTFEQEYLDLVSNNGWASAYQRIGAACNRFTYTLDEAKKSDNKSLNRYRDVNPFDHTRVVLKRCDNDYINANFVTLERANRRYILTQGPLAFTMGHFWLMIWEQNSKAILMLNKVLEKNEIKCHWYWPEQPGEENKMTFNDVHLAVTLISEEDSRYYVTRVLRLEDLESGTHRDITQFHYTTWPDFGVPTSPNAFLRFLKQVRDAGVLDSIEEPTVVHCSAGIGRSGTFCLVDCGLVIVEKEGIENLNIPQLLIEMRRHRMGLIQTPDQLRFSYQAILEGYKRMDPSWQDNDEEEGESIYSSVGEDEAPPPPPPRGESLKRPPGRPLPAIPTSESLGNLNLPPPQESSSSDECPPALPARKFSPPTSSDDDDVESVAESGVSNQELRRRRNVELAERVSQMKRKARETERWHALKRSIYKPLTITFGFLLAGIIIYSYVKH